MNQSIGFPNLGIELENVGKSITVFGYEIAYYGMVIGLGIMLGLWVAVKQANKTNQNPEDYYDLTMFGVIFSFLGARLYYVVFSWEYYKNNLNQIFNIRQGGLAIYGGVITAILVVFIFSWKKKLNTYLILDTAVLGLVTGQIIGRWGNFFNREAFGDYTNNLLAMKLPTSAVRTTEITDTMVNNLITIGEETFIQVHPTFLYESTWNLALFLFMLWYVSRKKFDGEIFLIYLMGYGIGRSWIESLRTDQLLLSNGLAVSQLLAIIMAIGSLIFIGIIRLKINKSEKTNKI